MSAEPVGAAAGADAALAAYARFLAHQLGELAVLAGALAPGAPADGVRARLERMLADLHDLTAEALEQAPVDLASEAQEVAMGLSEPGRAVRLKAERDAPPASGDPRLLRALLGHLMRPVVAAADGGVSFALRGTHDGDRVRFELTDDAGPASLDGAAERLITYGSRAGAAGKLLGAGVSGPAAARIVAVHGGTIEIRPAAEGASAVFDLPAAG